MTHHRVWELPESHLLPDAVVAFVDQELSAGAHERAAAHVAHCSSCAEEVAAQRAASTAVRHAEAPPISAGFLANLRAIPQHTEILTTPESLAVAQDGQLVTVQRSGSSANQRNTPPNGALGSSAPLGTSPNTLGNGARLGMMGRRAAQGAGVVVSGLMLGALALVVTSSDGHAGGPGTEIGNRQDVPPFTDGLRVQMGTAGGPMSTRVPTTSSLPASPLPTSPLSTSATIVTTTETPQQGLR